MMKRLRIFYIAISKYHYDDSEYYILYLYIIYILYIYLLHDYFKIPLRWLKPLHVAFQTNGNINLLSTLSIVQFFGFHKMKELFRTVRIFGGWHVALIKICHQEILKVGKCVGRDKYGNTYWYNPYYYFALHKWVEYAPHFNSDHSPTTHRYQRNGLAGCLIRPTWHQMRIPIDLITSGWWIIARTWLACLKCTIHTPRPDRKFSPGSHLSVLPKFFKIWCIFFGLIY